MTNIHEDAGHSDVQAGAQVGAPPDMLAGVRADSGSDAGSDTGSPRSEGGCGFGLATKLALLAGGLGVFMTLAFTVLSAAQMRAEITTSYHHSLETVVRMREGLLVKQYGHLQELLALLPEPDGGAMPSAPGPTPFVPMLAPALVPGSTAVNRAEVTSATAQHLYRLLDENAPALPLGAQLVFLDRRSVVLAPAALRDQELPVTLPAGLLAQASISRRVHQWNGQRGSYFYRVFYFAPQQWYVVCLMPVAALDEVLARRTRQVQVTGLGLTLLGCLLALYFGRRLAESLRTVDKAARILPTLDLLHPLPSQASSSRSSLTPHFGQLGQSGQTGQTGQFGPPALPALPPLPLSRGDEVGALAHSFDAMVQQLQQNVRNMLALGQEQARVQGELHLARAIQDGMLAQEFPRHPALDMHGCVLPAREVGGDFYDAFMLDDRHCCFAVGDVSDKGVAAALTMSMTLCLMRTLVRQNVSAQNTGGQSASGPVNVAAVLTQINAALCHDNPRHIFVTMILGVLNCETGLMTWANAGHPPPVRFCRAETAPPSTEPVRVEILPTCSEMVAGASEAVKYTALTCALQPGDRVVLYTDGISEAQREDGQRFGGPPAFLEGMPKGASAINWRIIERVEMFVGGAPQADDITLLNFMWRGPRAKI